MTEQRLVSGDPTTLAVEGVKQISGATKKNCSMVEAISEVYGTSISEEAGDLLSSLDSSDQPETLIGAASYHLDSPVDRADLISILDSELENALCPRDTDASKVVNKSERESVAVSEVVEAASGGTVYMAKTVSSSKKVRIAWNLNESNQVVKVDEYEKWEEMLGWEKLKQFPHGKNKIREELGDQLSEDVLERVTAAESGSDRSSSKTKKTQRTRTEPSDEVLNVARSRRHKHRRKFTAEQLSDKYESGSLPSVLHRPIDQLILFPSTTDLNMTSNWWMAGGRWLGGGYAGLANCNKSTFEYLNRHDEVWHVEEYIDQASEYTFSSSVGTVSLDVMTTDNLVMHVVKEDMYDRLSAQQVMDGMTSAIPQYLDRSAIERYNLPHPDDLIYAPITQEQFFWLKPALQPGGLADDVTVFCGDTRANVPGRNQYRLSSDYTLYARARLSDWDFDSIELSTLDDADHYFKLDDGGYELVETLGKLHDLGKVPFSQSPESRWQ